VELEELGIYLDLFNSLLYFSLIDYHEPDAIYIIVLPLFT